MKGQAQVKALGDDFGSVFDKAVGAMQLRMASYGVLRDLLVAAQVAHRQGVPLEKTGGQYVPLSPAQRAAIQPALKDLMGLHDGQLTDLETAVSGALGGLGECQRQVKRAFDLLTKQAEALAGADKRQGAEQAVQLLLSLYEKVVEEAKTGFEVRGVSRFDQLSTKKAISKDGS